MIKSHQMLTGAASVALLTGCATMDLPGLGPSAETVTPQMLAEEIVPGCDSSMQLASVEGGVALGIGQGGTNPGLAAVQSRTLRYDEVNTPQTVNALRADLDRMIRLSGCTQVPYNLMISSDDAITANANCETVGQVGGAESCTITLSSGLMYRLTPDWYETEEALEYGYGSDSEDAKPIPTSEDLKRWRNFILAHEYSHLLMNHPHEYKEILEEAQTGGRAVAALGLVTAGAKLVATAYDLNKAGNSLAAQAAAEEDSMEAAGVFLGAAVAGMWLNAEVQRASYPPQVRALENDADYLATLILMRADRTIHDSNQQYGLDNPLYEPEIGANALEHLFNENKSFTAKLKEEAETAGKTAAATAGVMGLTAGGQMIAEAAGGQDQDIGKTMKTIALTAGALYIADRMKARYDPMSYPLHANPSARVDQIVSAADLLLPDSMRPSEDARRFAVITEDGTPEQTAAVTEETFYGSRRIEVSESDREALSRDITTTVFMAEMKMLADASKMERLVARGELETAKDIAKPYWGMRDLESVPTDLLKQLATLALTEGQLVTAERNYDAFLSRDGVPQSDYSITARAFMQAGDLDRATKYLNLGEARTGKRTLFLPTRIEIAILKEDDEAVEALLEECAVDPSVLSACQDVLPEKEAVAAASEATTAAEEEAANPINNLMQRFTRD